MTRKIVVIGLFEEKDRFAAVRTEPSYGA